MSGIRKDEVVEVLESIAHLLEIKGEVVFKIRAYENAARAIDNHSGDVLQLAREGRLREIPGVGDAIAKKVGELVTTGRLEFFETLKTELPASLLELFRLQGLGAKKVKLLYERLGIKSLDELEAACRDGRVAALPGFGAKSVQSISAAIDSARRHSGRFLLGDVAVLARVIEEKLREHPAVSRVQAAGSFRRRMETVHDLDFIVATRKPAEVIEAFVSDEMVESVIARGDTKASVRLRAGIQADLRAVASAEFPFALNYFTGSKDHNIAMRTRALQRGWSLNEYALTPATGRKKSASPVPKINEERDIYAALGLDYIEPELRENTREFHAATEHELPDLIELENLRGIFHCHTTDSDGRASLDEMASAARELGFQYIGIADHSKSSHIAHGLDEARLEAQMARIAKMNDKADGDFRIFSGTECDVMRDGSLDFSEELLGRLDYVVASIHQGFKLPEAEMTRRIIRAISHPCVTILGHLTGRLLLERDGYAVDVPAIIEAAAETGTVIELNAQPRRLELDWRWWPMAKERGVKCAINPDAHSVAALEYVWFGVAQARKGWLTRADVINCLPLGKIEKQLARKRAK